MTAETYHLSLIVDGDERQTTITASTPAELHAAVIRWREEIGIEHAELRAGD